MMRTRKRISSIVVALTVLLSLAACQTTGTTVAKPELPKTVGTVEADRLYDSGKFDEAQELYRRELAGAPGNPYFKLMIGKTLIAAENYDEAELYLESLALEFPDSVDLLLDLVRVYAKLDYQEKIDGVREKLVKIYASDPGKKGPPAIPRGVIKVDRGEIQVVDFLERHEFAVIVVRYLFRLIKADGSKTDVITYGNPEKTNLMMSLLEGRNAMETRSVDHYPVDASGHWTRHRLVSFVRSDIPYTDVRRIVIAYVKHNGLLK